MAGSRPCSGISYRGMGSHRPRAAYVGVNRGGGAASAPRGILRLSMSTDANALAPPDGRPGRRSRLGHIRGLDGVRAVAVLALIAFHSGVSSIPGGFYGVDAFFVLSGYLITTLLITEWAGTGTIRLRRFWSRRARRLLPALFVLVAVIGIVLITIPRLLATPHVIGDALSTIFYASNWYSIHGGVSYFSTVQQQSPLVHTWSLAIEEQFYLCWPLIVLAVLKLGTGTRSQQRHERRGRRQSTVRVMDGGFITLLPRGAAEPDPAWTRRRRLHLLFALSGFGACASALWMAVVAPDGYYGPGGLHAYYGTDTRAQALLVGATIAAGLALWKPGELQWFRRLAGVLGVAGLVGTGVLWALVSQSSLFAFSGGFLVASFAAGGVVLCAAVNKDAPSVWLLEIPPLPWLGQISYGIYLWYWPVLLVMSGQRLPGWGVYELFAGRVAVTVALATVSAYVIELPIRRGALSHWRSWVAAPLGAAAAIGAVMASTLVPVGATSPLTTGPTTTTTTTTTTKPGAPPPIEHHDVDLRAGPHRHDAGDSDRCGDQTGEGAAAGRLDRRFIGGRVERVRDQPARADRQRGDPGVLAGHGSGDQGALVHVAARLPVCVGRPECAPGDVEEVGRPVQPRRRRLPGAGRDVRPGARRRLGRHWGAGLRPLHREPVPPGRADTGVAGRHRGAADVALLLERDLAGRDDLARGHAEPGRARQQGHPRRGHLDDDRAQPHPGLRVQPQRAGRPGAHFVSNLGPVNLRCSDGVHFSRPGGVFIGLQLLPDLALLGQAHADASPGGSWSGTFPSSEPAWYTKLPCQ